MVLSYAENCLSKQNGLSYEIFLFDRHVEMTKVMQDSATIRVTGWLYAKAVTEHLI